MTIRDTRLQAAIVRDGRLLLVQCTLPGEPPFWVLPGGGREAGESDAEAVAREVREELGVAVEVGAVLDDVPADPPDGMYTRWRTFACRLAGGGKPTACGTDGSAELTAVRWLPLAGRDEWDAELLGDPFLRPQLERIRTALGATRTRVPRLADESRGTGTGDKGADMDVTTTLAQPVLDSFYSAVVACGREPPFKPTIRVATTPGATRYDPASRAVVLVPYETLDGARRAAMDRFAAIGTLGLSGPEQYREVFNHLLVAHELAHWLQEVAQRPLNRWQAEYEANRMMVAFWRDHPAAPPAAETERRLANFVAQAPNAPAPMPDGAGMSVEDYFNAHIAEIEGSPAAYAGFQKMMVRQAAAERPAPSFCQLVAEAWPR